MCDGPSYNSILERNLEHQLFGGDSLCGSNKCCLYPHSLYSCSPEEEDELGIAIGALLNIYTYKRKIIDSNCLRNTTNKQLTRSVNG